jgi:hypothetical protein
MNENSVVQCRQYARAARLAEQRAGRYRGLDSLAPVEQRLVRALRRAPGGRAVAVLLAWRLATLVLALPRLAGAWLGVRLGRGRMATYLLEEQRSPMQSWLNAWALRALFHDDETGE